MIMISSKQGKINYAPQNTLEEIVENVKMILRVFKEEQPLNRDFALNSDFIDKNINIVENEIASHLIDIFYKYEKRVKLKQVEILMKDIKNNDFEVIVGIEVLGY